MPLIQVQALPQANTVDIPATVRKIAVAVAAALNVPEKVVLCTWTILEPQHYAEGNATGSTQQPGSFPPVVNMTLFEGRSAELIERAITAVAETLQEALGLPSPHAFITYHEGKSGQLFTSGRIKR
jgi:phenylpyruvate tautomerase PptA (4-oxalocrotonate tautomerase family)